jgi:hypothetical protein
MVMYNRLNKHMQCNNIFVPEQFGLGEYTQTQDVAQKIAVSVLKRLTKRR